MDKQEVLARIQQLEFQKVQSIAQANAIDGAIQDCKYWIEEFDKKEREQKAEVPSEQSPN